MRRFLFPPKVSSMGFQLLSKIGKSFGEKRQFFFILRRTGFRVLQLGGAFRIIWMSNELDGSALVTANSDFGHISTFGRR
jgi:hypothetical protein